MQRRRFILAACAAATAAALPGVSSAVAQGRKLTPETGFQAGDRFEGDQGSVLVVSEVIHCSRDAHCHQFEVRFREVAGPRLAEGMHCMSGSGGSREFFLQSAQTGLVATFNQLIQGASQSG